MPNLHDQNISGVRKITGYALSILPSLMIVFSGVMKIIQDEFMIQAMETLQLRGLIVFIGFLEILCVVLYWIPKTMNIGFFLMCSYVGGIIAAELIGAKGDALPIPGIPVAVMLYVGTMLRKKELSGLGI